MTDSGNYPPPPGGYQPAPPPPGYPGYPGQPGHPGYGYGYPAPQQSNGMAVTALVLGIIGMVLFWFPFVGQALNILAIVFGSIGLSTANRGATGKGQAIAGLVLGIVGLVLFVALVSLG